MNSTAKALSNWQTTTREVLGIEDEIAERSARINKAQREVLTPLMEKQAALRAATAALRKLEAAAWLENASTNTPAIRDAAATVRTLDLEVKALGERAEYIRPAVESLQAEITARQQTLALIQQSMPRQILAAIDAQLAEHAERQRTAIRAYQAAQEELCALAVARNKISPKVPGSDALNIQDLTHVRLPVPALPAYAGMAGELNFYHAAEQRSRDILSDLGVGS